MPALIGGFLRHGRVDNDIFFYFILGIFMSSLTAFLALHMNLNTGGVFNEAFSEGCVKWGKARNVDEEPSTLDLTSLVFLSLTKVNYCYKDGSAIPASFNKLLRFRGEISVKGIPETVCSKTASTANTITEKNLKIIHDIILCQKVVYSKRGNPGHEVYRNLIIILSKLLKIRLLLYLVLKYFLNLVSFNLLCSSIQLQESGRVHGGKICEKANAPGNTRDSINFILNKIGCPVQYCKGQKLNSLSLKKNLPFYKRYYSTVKDESKLEITAIKRQLKNNHKFNWPNSKTLNVIRKEVFKQQVELVSLANVYGLYSNELFKKQQILFNSLFFRIVAIDKLLKSSGSKTPGVDNIKLVGNKKDNNLLSELLESTRLQIKNPYKYKSSPVKRVGINKTNNKLRPLGIPTIQDRVLQHLLNLILEPLVEMTSDLHSYGFRPYRSAKQAVAFLKANLKTLDAKTIETKTSTANRKNELFQLLPENKFILDADIEGFFNNINHCWLLNNLFLHPTLRLFVKEWLTSGALDKNIFVLTEKGAPQGRVISPTLANFTLNGLEKKIMDSINPLTKSKDKRISITLKDGSKTRIGSYLTYVRYANDSIVLVRSRHLLKSYVIPSIESFLKERGLRLNSQKTKIFRLSDKNAQLDFLGYTFKYNTKWKIKSHVFYTHHAGSRGIALYPNKKKMHNFIAKIKFMFKKSNNLDAYTLIVKLNRILREWSNYYNMANSSHYRNTLRNALYRLTWKWAKRKHKRWGKKAIANTYFLRTIEIEKNFSQAQNPEMAKSALKKPKYSKFKNTKWVFHGKSKCKSRYHIRKFRIIYLVDVSNISQLLSSKHFILPKNIQQIHGYHPNYMKLATFNTNLKFKSAGLNSSLKERLLKRQNDLCSYCHETLSDFESLYGTNMLHIHHIKPIFKGGSRDDISNMELLHSWCHYEIDHKNNSEN
jgi:RNA-directed DNA polymerase